MTVRIGDALFIRNGQPGIVKDRRVDNGKLVLETDQAKVKEEMRHGYLNGLTEENRASLYEILDKVKSDSVDPNERVEAIRVKLDELEQDPRNVHLTRYLRAEMTHIMNTFDIRPKEYSIYESKAR